MPGTDDTRDPFDMTRLLAGAARTIARAGEVVLVFQHDADDAYLTLCGRARLHTAPAEVRRRWKAAYDVYFPSEADRTNAAFVAVEVTRMELWIRGVTPEPFGLRPTVLERKAGGAWRLLGAGRDAA